MFQPQATPYAPFFDFAAFQPSAGSVVDSGGPTVFRNPPIFTSVASNNLHAGGGGAFNNTNPARYKMETSEIEAQEALARTFAPALAGPLVGNKKSSHAITEEYAKADPIYVAKTAALPQKYSHYRPIAGDGNCGWRAVGFSYFETLVRFQQRSQLEAEVVRMLSLNNLLIKFGGFEDWVFEDMVAETTALLKDLSNLVEISPPDAEALLLDRFNDESVSNMIVYHLKMLASSWLQKDAERYQGFITDGSGVEGYRKNCLEPVNTEIEHLGMTLLIDVLLKPIGIHVEIVYLDRSEGSQVNAHLIQPVDQNGNPTNPGGPVLHLLYRPSHYDILYQDLVPVLQPIATDMDIQVQRAFAPQHMPQATPYMDMSVLGCIPGVSFSMPQQPLRQHSYSSQYQPPSEQAYTPPSMAPSASPISPGASSTTTVSSHGLPTFPPQQQSTPMPPQQPSPIAPSPHTQTFPTLHAQLPILTHLPPPHRSPLPSEQPSPNSATSFRPSKYEWEAAADWSDAPVVFQTSTFKNSHYNTAHYNNPNFQPEEWTPEGEEMERLAAGPVARGRGAGSVGSAGGGGSRRKGSS